MKRRGQLKRYTRLRPVSPKRKSRVGKLGIVRLCGADVEPLRLECFTRDRGICQWAGCRVYAPWDGSLWQRGHMAHITGRGAGGSDVIGNVRWLCAKHHLNFEHNGIEEMQ